MQLHFLTSAKSVDLDSQAQAAAPSQPQPPPLLLPKDLRTESPVQVCLQSYPVRMFNGIKRSFWSSWFKGREWLEYSRSSDSAFCFPCRKFSLGPNSDKAFTLSGYSNWRHAMDFSKGFSRHASAKEHLKCMALWKEKELRSIAGTEVSTLVNSRQLDRNCKYFSAIVDRVSCLKRASSQLDAFQTMGEGGSGLFLSMMDYTLRKDKELAEVYSTIPANAKYTSHDIQNEIMGGGCKRFYRIN